MTPEQRERFRALPTNSRNRSRAVPQPDTYLPDAQPTDDDAWHDGWWLDPQGIWRPRQATKGAGALSDFVAQSP